MNMLCPKYEVKDLEIFDVVFPVWLKLLCSQAVRDRNAFVSLSAFVRISNQRPRPLPIGRDTLYSTRTANIVM